MTTKKQKMRAPNQVRSKKETCQLARDNFDTKHGWILADDRTVTIAQQEAGKEPSGKVTLPRAEFLRLARWYFRPQRIVRS